MNMADTLNLHCRCSTLQPQLLRESLESAPALAGLADTVSATRPHLFSRTPVFISTSDRDLMARSVAVLHRVATLPGYQAAALARAPALARHAFGPSGAFMGYDFHIGAQGPRLIEINTNAGGGFLHAAALRAHRACCDAMDRRYSGREDVPERVEQAFIDMFRSEWRAQRGDQPLRSIAIVDSAPASQYLAPEFELARELFQRHGIATVVADPAELQWRDGALWHPALPPGLAVDLVYNRLTDFYLAEPAHAALAQAYACGAVVLTPHPRAHALHADKRNLIALSDDALLARWGASDADRAQLAQVVPRTRALTPESAQALWAQRRQLFFKPASGYGAKAAYRGDKITRRAWDDALAGGFVAQDLVAPSERVVDVDGQPSRLKLDVRAYAYQGRILLLAARTYAGQTTNFRTPGGGFSPVVVLPDTEPTTMALTAETTT